MNAMFQVSKCVQVILKDRVLHTTAWNKLNYRSGHSKFIEPL